MAILDGWKETVKKFGFDKDFEVTYITDRTLQSSVKKQKLACDVLIIDEWQNVSSDKNLPYFMSLSVTPEILLPPVWPPPLSLATTRGISVDVFSSPYLDVSVQAVPLPYLFDSVWDTLRWVSPFGNLRIKAHLQLPEAYRSLSRPSSAPDAKAFPLRSY